MSRYKCITFKLALTACLFLTGLAGGLPLSSLRLMASPLQFTYSFIWQVLRQRNIKQYGKVEEFVTMVTQTLPDLMTSKQTAQLILGIRARVNFMFYVSVCVCLSLLRFV